jgi:hypothetical protein
VHVDAHTVDEVAARAHRGGRRYRGNRGSIDR